MQPIEQRFEKIEQRLEKIEQQQTEPIKVTRIEIDTGGILEQLAEMNKLLSGIGERQADHGERFDRLAHVQQETKEIHTISNVWLDALQENIGDIKAGQASHNERFDTVERAIGAVQSDVSSLKATQDDHSALLKDQGQKLDLILHLLQKRGE